MFKQSSIKGENVGQESVLRCTKEILEETFEMERETTNWQKDTFCKDKGCSL